MGKINGGSGSKCGNGESNLKEMVKRLTDRKYWLEGSRNKYDGEDFQIETASVVQSL